MTLSITFAEIPTHRPDSADQDCPDWEPGPAFGGQCQTDGHYECRACVHNIHRLEEHSPCHFTPCPGPGKPCEMQ